jgi:hypothetical protein
MTEETRGTTGDADASKPDVTPNVEPATVAPAGPEPATEAFAARAATPAEPADPSFGLLDQALVERRSLVALCLYALDRARSSGVAQRIEHGLAEAGVLAVRPDGQRFDPSVHEAGGTLPTQDAGLDGVVAETEVVGFTDRGRVLRAPVVIVYQLRAQA